MPGHRIVVLKFGSSVLRSEQELVDVVAEIRRWVEDEHRVIAVVSALAGQTDLLLEKAGSFGRDVTPGATARLAELGELHSAALLGLALDAGGLTNCVLDAGALGWRATGSPLDASPDRLDTEVVDQVLGEHEVLVAPGFAGRDGLGRTVLFGRGGSDLSALFLAHAVGARRCRLVKDVDGLYERDPALPGPAARRFTCIAWERALELDGSIVQHKAIRFARDRILSFEVSCLMGDDATIVGGAHSELSEAFVPPCLESVTGPDVA